MADDLGEIGIGDPDLPPGESLPSDPAPSDDPGLPPREAADDAAPKLPDGPAPIPFNDHDRIVKGFHKRYDPVAWAEGYDPRQVNRALAIAELYESGKLGTSREPEPKAPETLGPDKIDEAGNVLYSPERAAQMAEQLADRAVARAIAKVEERIGPLEETNQRSQVLSSVNGTIDKAISAGWPMLDQVEVQNEMADAVQAATRSRQTLSLPEAYIQVVLPKLMSTREAIRAEERKSILEEMNLTSDAARDEISPRTRPPAKRQSYEDMDFGDAMRAEVASIAAKSAR